MNEDGPSNGGAVVRYNCPMAVLAKPLTLEHFLALPEIDGRRLELIAGGVYEKPVPTWPHGIVAGELYVAFRPFGSGAVEPRAIMPSSGGRADYSPIPDFAFYLAGAARPVDWMRSPPAVVAKVLSPGQTVTSIGQKIASYREFGIRCIWVFDLAGRTVDSFEGDAHRRLGASDRLTTDLVPGLSIDLDELFARCWA